ncbi:metallophosphoesterase family protein [Candidatus Uabimicrobium amorphum]|uniref:Phosphoesterase n=1 Tax=Uabimicrobium amorphum TaxID=2596890 RepID=A0A5S9F285_UABAM|nr:metallophosphoesterase family protein [Candidatus Uabimicrobium amorphum]BBM82981.1 phosphoesterase [Candidatus Uabimicrobium amorphum]
MPRYALLSDIHANIEALQAVLADVEKRNVDEILVLGDIIGYGPDPKECWEKVCEVANVMLIGNHEQEIVAADDDYTGGDVKAMLKWTEQQLQNSSSWTEFIAPITVENYPEYALKIYNGKTFVHAAAHSPTKQYIWPGYEGFYIIYNDQLDSRLLEFMSAFTTQHGFFGHTHVPTVLTYYRNKLIFDIEGTWNKEMTFIGPNTIFFVPQGKMRIEDLADKHAYINPGSVGQPRDGDPRAAYAIYDDTSIEFIRVVYDFTKTQEKVSQLPVSEGIKKRTIDRLAKGK